MTVDQIIAQLGGYTAVAKATGIPITTVHSWKRSGAIPEWRRPVLLALAKKLRAPIAASDFPASPRAAA